ncbi:MAG TPA: cyclic nucleotide-binding domain-containing protein, partial [Actinomycetota bacterium]
MPAPSGLSGAALTAQALTGVASPRAARPRIGRRGLPMLSAIPLFAGLSKRHLRHVADLAEEVRFRDGTVMVRAGTPGRALYVIAEGRARVARGVVPIGRAIARLGPGDFFGEIALLDGGPRSASVVADGPVVAIRLMRGAFLKLMRSEPAIAMAVVQTLAQR